MASKNTIVEIPAPQMDTSGYFEGDWLTIECGQRCEMFIISRDWRGKYCGFNINRFNEIMEREDLSTIDEFIDYMGKETGLHWRGTKAYGYCQGDEVTVIACTETFTEDDCKAYGEIWLGACREFKVLFDDDEDLPLTGIFIADSEVKDEQDYKTLICKEWGLNPVNTELRLVSGSRIVYDYKTI